MVDEAGLVARIENLISPIIAEEGLSLWMVEWTNELGRRILRVMVDKEGGILLDDCSRISHAIEDLIEVKGNIGYPYDLEISSPGLNRPLRTRRHFETAVGRKIRVRTARPLGERRNFKGVLKEAGPEFFVVEVDGKEFSIPYSEVYKANVEFEK